MKPFPIAAVLLALCLHGPAATAQQSSQYHLIPGAYACMDVSADGNVVVGWGSPGGGFTWNWREDPEPTFIGGEWIVACSTDGSVILGQVEETPGGPDVPALWDATNGWRQLCDLSLCNDPPEWLTPNDISGDGTAVVGLYLVGGLALGFHWTESGGLIELDELHNGTNNATTISRDGTRIGGFAQGNFSRTPALWTTGGVGTLYDPDVVGEVRGMNADGSIALGEYDGSAFAGTPVFGLLQLGSLNGSPWTGRAIAISADNTRIAGMDIFQLAKQAWVWDAGGSLKDLKTTAINDYGIAGVPDLHAVTGMSDDGRVIVGRNDFGGGWILELYENDVEITDLGGGMSGSHGTPQLDLSGPFTGGSAISMDVVDAPPNAPLLLWIAFASAPVPFFSGTVHAVPPAVEILLGADGAGELHIPAPWPAGIPADFSMWFQFLVGDPTKPWGFTMTNGVKITTPS